MKNSESRMKAVDQIRSGLSILHSDFLILNSSVPPCLRVSVVNEMFPERT
jgi:hypothetical protein